VSVVDADRLAELEDERRFLLRSLRDLDAELAAGDVDAGDYATLRDGYTKRAADVLRSIEEGKAALPAKRPGRWKRNIVGVAVVVAVALGAGILVARAAGQRTTGDQITGGVGGLNDTATLLAQARALLGVDLKAAQDNYTAVLDRDPTNPEALTYSGWLLYVASVQASDAIRQQAVDQAKQQMTKAIAADATYPDPHCFLAIMALRVDADAATSQAEQQRCLDLDPPAQIKTLMQSLTAPTDSSVPATTG
jgi:hypothetical protein